VENNKAAADLAQKGITIHAWTPEDRAAFREVAQNNWQVWAEKTPEARALVDSHVEFMTTLGLIQD
jgi:TRAP-type C4-dicarboxylate transport system substrate-binding protein